MNLNKKQTYMINFQEFTDIYFLDTSNGWIVSKSGHLLRTCNGGKSWEKITLEFIDSPVQVQFVSTKIGWIRGSSGKLYVSNDGGSHWKLQIDDVDKRFTNIYFINETIGWGYTYRGAVLSTNNGGYAWELKMSVPQFEIPPDPPPWGYYISILEDIFFLNEVYGWVIHQNNYSSNPTNTVYYTNNSGNSWISYSIPTRVHLQKVVFIDQLNGWVIGDGGIIFYTNSSGANWYNQLSFTEEKLCDMYFLNNTWSWICGTNGTILHTMNGGNNWTNLSNSSITVDFNRIYFQDASIGWVIGAIPEIFISNDGGFSWQLFQLTSLFMKKNWIWILILLDSIFIFMIIYSFHYRINIRKNRVVHNLQSLCTNFSYTLFFSKTKVDKIISVLVISCLIYGFTFIFTLIHELSHVFVINLLGGYADYIEINYTLFGYTHIPGLFLNSYLLLFYLAGLFGEIFVGLILLKITFYFREKYRFIFFLSLVIIMISIIAPLFYFTLTPMFSQSDGYYISQILNIPSFIISLIFLPLLIFSIFFFGKNVYKFYVTFLNSKREFLYILLYGFIIFISVLCIFSQFLHNSIIISY
ncbi:MAG: M50 family metallopeptidase [Candidatus Helarchaeota archaeon]